MLSIPVAWGFLSFVVISAKADCTKTSFPSSQQEISQFLATDHDYLIIGGGTAGLTVAARLAEDPDITVGVLEAGGIHYNDPLVNTPGFFYRLAGNETYDWSFSSLPQSNLLDRNVLVSRGKGLGGSSAINFMASTRASAAEYDAWGKIAGSDQWSWKKLVPFFQRTERVVPRDPYPDFSEGSPKRGSSYDGYTGPIPISVNEYYPDNIPFLVQAFNRLGAWVNEEPTSGNGTGVTNARLTVDHIRGSRSYAAKGYYCDSVPRSNLQVLVGARVTKINFDAGSSPLVANGAHFVIADREYDVKAKRATILSTGAIQTPQLLELSGIGNSSILEAAGIAPLVDRPGVGENLQEHVFAGVQWELKPGYETFDALNDPAFAAAQAVAYETSRTGMLASFDSTLTYLPFRAVVSKERLSELRALHQQTSTRNYSVEAIQLGVQKSWLQEGEVAQVELITWSRGLINPTPGKSYVTTIGGGMHPTSRGTVHISRNDAFSPPDIDLCLLCTEFDRQVTLDALKYIQKIGQQEPFASIVAEQQFPSPDAQSDEELLGWIKAAAGIGHHSAGTAVMAPEENGGVVDASLRVYGTSNLLVVDASIFPIQIATHPQATIYAIAESAAAMILEQHKAKSNANRTARGWLGMFEDDL